MRSIQDINADEIAEVNKIMSEEGYWPVDGILTAKEIYDNVFGHTGYRFAGLTIVKAYEYLRSVNIDIFIPWDNNYKQTEK